MQRLEELANYFTYMVSQEPREKCMLTKGYEPVVRKRWICYSRWAP
jgi:hypothetical protein